MITEPLMPGQDGAHPTFCRICEAFCGLVVDVRGGHAESVRPDKENPHSLGHVCVKGMAAAQLAYDPDRITSPMRRVGPDLFEPVTWDEALDDIAARLLAVRQHHGDEAIASYAGNPSAFSTDLLLGLNAFMSAIGVTKLYGAGSQDSNARLAANFILYGSSGLIPFPDLPNCDLLVIIGANPLVSNGSGVFAPRIRHDLDAIAARGRVIVVDPRLTETAKRYEHVPIKPNGDVWMLLAMLRVMRDEELLDDQQIEREISGWTDLSAELEKIDPADAARHSGVPLTTIVELARALTSTPRAALYNRVGVCRGPFATLTNFLVSAINALAGKHGRVGGYVFGLLTMAGQGETFPGGYGEVRSRVGNVPSVAQTLPAAMLPADILEEGEGQVRALIVTSGNPVLSAPGGERLIEALKALHLFVSFDLYHTETNRYAHYILPGLTFLERADVPMLGLFYLMRPFLQYTDAVIRPVGDARDEFEVFRDLAARMGARWPQDCSATGRPDKTNTPWSPLRDVDSGIRNGFVGDHFGVRDGWSFEKLRSHPHGVMVDIPADDPAHRARIAHADGKIHVWDDIVAAEFERLYSARKPDSHELRLIGRRDIRSINSWMHNVEDLVRSSRPSLLVHPADAARSGVANGDVAQLRTDFGEVDVLVTVTSDIVEGCVCYPHGWGHSGGWRTANRTTGVNINELLGVGIETLEFVSGTTHMDGVPVILEASS